MLTALHVPIKASTEAHIEQAKRRLAMHSNSERHVCCLRVAAAAIDEVVEAANGFPEPEDTTWEGSEYQEGLEVLQRFFRDNEVFRGKVKRPFVRAEFEAVSPASSCASLPCEWSTHAASNGR